MRCPTVPRPAPGASNLMKNKHQKIAAARAWARNLKNTDSLERASVINCLAYRIITLEGIIEELKNQLESKGAIK